LEGISAVLVLSYIVYIELIFTFFAALCENLSQSRKERKEIKFITELYNKGKKNAAENYFSTALSHKSGIILL
jgi:hypothetical protein